MSVWETLGVPPHSNAAIIKKAYARLLKHNRPDENPVAFKTLHAAYREALSLSTQEGLSEEHLIDVSDNSDAEESNLDGEGRESSGTYKQLTQVDGSNYSCDGQPAILDQRSPSPEERAYEALITQVDELLTSSGGDRLAEWRFLSGSSWLLDPAFNHKLGRAVFGRVAIVDASAGADNRIATLAVSEESLLLLNDLFNWREERSYLYSVFGSAQANCIFEVLDNQSDLPAADVRTRGGHTYIPEKAHDGEQYQWVVTVSRYRKIAAFTLDVAIFALFAYVVSQNLIFGDSAAAVPLLESFLYDPLTQVMFVFSSPLLARLMRWSTPGKWLMGYQVFAGKLCQLTLSRGVGLGIAFMLMTLWMSLIVNLVSGVLET